jgi:hypothetical protein
MLSLILPTFAQLSTATMFGTVTDPEGATIPKATVTITNTGYVRTVVTNEDGTYRADFLPIGQSDFNWPEIYQFNIGFQQQFTNSFVVSANYVGSLSRKFPSSTMSPIPSTHQEQRRRLSVRRQEHFPPTTLPIPTPLRASTIAVLSTRASRLAAAPVSRQPHLLSNKTLSSRPKAPTITAQPISAPRTTSVFVASTSGPSPCKARTWSAPETSATARPPLLRIPTSSISTSRGLTSTAARYHHLLRLQVKLHH